MPKFEPKWMGIAAVLTSGFFYGSTGLSAPVLNDYAAISKLLAPPAHLEINAAGISEYDKSAWTIEKQGDGTELYSLRSAKTAKNSKKASVANSDLNAAPPSSRVAIMRNSNGDLESMAIYKLGTNSTEDSGSLLFENHTLTAYTSCEDRGEKEIGRVCVTATPDLCHSLKVGQVQPQDLKKTETAEMRSLAIILTLRGADHQLDNMAKTGNRLGLKTALQTTSGQLIALGREIAKEQAASTTTSSPRAPAANTADSAKLASEEKLAQSVLERSLPRLKQACSETHFN